MNGKEGKSLWKHNNVISKWPVLTREEVNDLEQYLAERGKEIDDEEVCVGAKVQSMPGSPGRANLWSDRRRTLRNDGIGRTGAGRH